MKRRPAIKRLAIIPHGLGALEIHEALQEEAAGRSTCFALTVDAAADLGTACPTGTHILFQPTDAAPAGLLVLARLPDGEGVAGFLREDPDRLVNGNGQVVADEATGFQIVAMAIGLITRGGETRIPMKASGRREYATETTAETDLQPR